MTADNQQDELIFDFLEGNLSADEREAFTILKDESELFSREVRLWQNTYVEEALPEIGTLEQKLLIHAVPDTRNQVTRIYAVLLILFVYITIPADKINVFTPDLAERNRSNVALPVQEIKDAEIVSGCVEQTDPKVTCKVKQPGETASNDDLITSAVSLSDLKLKPLVGSGKTGLQKAAGKMAPSRPASVAARKKWSKREIRLIRQKRRQDNIRHQANEFQKGRVPYVVPLNSNNF